jgi:DNA-binding FrmR family transcriptional regulator
VSGIETPRVRTAAVHHARRLTGQVAALPTMIAANRSLEDIAQQIVAARGSLDALLLRLILLDLLASPATPKARVDVERGLRLGLGRRRAESRAHRAPTGIG